MKKTSILIAAFVAMAAAASPVRAEGPQINFDGRTPGAMSFTEALKAMEMPQAMIPAPEILPSKSDILIQAEYYKLNIEDRKRLQETAKAALEDTVLMKLINNEELSVLFCQREVLFKDLSGNALRLSEKQNRQALALVRGIVGKPANGLSARYDMDNSTWMQPVCVRWDYTETTIPKKVCKVVNAYVSGGWVGTLVCEMVPTTVTVRVCAEYQSGI